jgi:hypothetical protein
MCHYMTTINNNSVALDRERTIPIEQGLNKNEDGNTIIPCDFQDTGPQNTHSNLFVVLYGVKGNFIL